MKIIGIDTSCDDTAVAVLEIAKNKTTLLSNVVSSQVKLHAEYGGVYPTLAKREHQRNLPIVLIKALQRAGLVRPTPLLQAEEWGGSEKNPKLKKLEKILEREEVLQPKLLQFLEKYQKPDIDAIAVTIGPGLEPCLWVGVNFARALALWWDLPIIPANHLEAHLLANFINKEKRKRFFPAVGLVVSGGNTQLFLIKGIGKYKLLGETRDDAAGECFDKTARILGLGYPGGPAIAAEAAKFKVQSSKFKVELPRPMINTKDYDFSFSGLKTAVLYNYKKQSKIIRESAEYRIAMAHEIQQAVIDVLLKKTLRAAKEYQIKTIILGGGVAANDELQKQFKSCCLKLKKDFLFPPKNLCADNAAMVALAASFHFQNQKKWGRIKPSANLIV